MPRCLLRNFAGRLIGRNRHLAVLIATLATLAPAAAATAFAVSFTRRFAEALAFSVQRCNGIVARGKIRAFDAGCDAAFHRTFDRLRSVLTIAPAAATATAAPALAFALRFSAGFAIRLRVDECLRRAGFGGCSICRRIRTTRFALGARAAATTFARLAVLARFTRLACLTRFTRFTWLARLTTFTVLTAFAALCATGFAPGSALFSALRAIAFSACRVVARARTALTATAAAAFGALAAFRTIAALTTLGAVAALSAFATPAAFTTPAALAALATLAAVTAAARTFAASVGRLGRRR